MVPELVARLAAEIDRLDARTPVPMHLIINEGTGEPYNEDTFRHVFAAVRAQTAETHPVFDVDTLMPGRDSTALDAFQVRMLDLTFMRLRHTAVTRLAEAECDTTLISGITGHSQVSVQQLMSRYMVRTRSLARAAFQKRLDMEGKG